MVAAASAERGANRWSHSVWEAGRAARGKESEQLQMGPAVGRRVLRVRLLGWHQGAERAAGRGSELGPRGRGLGQLGCFAVGFGFSISYPFFLSISFSFPISN